MKNKGTVVIVDDEEGVRRSLERLLPLLGYKTQSLGSGRELIGLEFRPFSERGPTCILLDLRIEDESGLDVQKALFAGHPPVIFMTGHGQIVDCVEAISAGALDFLEKPVDEGDLVRSIDHAFSIDRANAELNSTVVDVNESIKSLTQREHDVLRQVLTGRINKVIADELGITEKTVKVHRARVLKKMQVRSVAELTRQCAFVGIEPAEETNYPLQPKPFPVTPSDRGDTIVASGLTMS